MGRTSPLIWLALVLIFLVPTAAGRLVLDLAGGLMIVFLALPLLLTGLGWLGWRILQSRMITCKKCGMSSFKDSSGLCPLCGAGLSEDFEQQGFTSFSKNSPPASAATIDVSAEDAGSDPD